MSRVTGAYHPQPGGYRAFHPAPLPPDPPLALTAARVRLLSEADRAVAGLDSVTDLLPDPDGFVYSYVRREAVLSSRIEGTQSSLDDLVRREAGIEAGRGSDVNEVSNYVAALNEALAALPDMPISARLIRMMHHRLMQDTRGGHREPGEFRRHQVHIGAEGTGLGGAIFVPPPPDAVPDSIAALESYIHASEALVADAPLIRIGLAHAQFETIHPFGDGNGRCGRLLISLLLAEKKLLRQPVLYLSLYFSRNRQAYYDHLQATRDQGDFEGWIDFFLRGVIETAADARDRARRILRMREDHRDLILARGGGAKALRLLDHLFRQPYVSMNGVAERLEISFPTASRMVENLEQDLILREVTGQQRGRIYVYQPYIDLFSDR
jgi:Fic family protein